jgi:holo-[acyl-carrier protein] synthase
MIAGHGIDLVDIGRIRRIIARYGERFIARCFHASEIERSRCYADAAPYFAARWAAKEAFSKAVGTGFIGFGPRDVIIVREKGKPPRVAFSEKLKEKFPDTRESDFALTISHEKEMAVASVIWVKKF